MHEYKLENHLNSLCAQHHPYIDLYSTWTLNKRACTDFLKNVVIRYPHFSMHDSSHAETVISNMEMLLGDRIQSLSPTDTWLLLHAAYAHDLGMVIKWSEIQTLWKQSDFQEFLLGTLSSLDPDLREAAEFVRSVNTDSFEKTWPLKAHRSVDLLNAAYFRSRHARMSKKYMASSDPDFDLDLGHNNLIQPRLIKLLSQICALHTEGAEKVLELDYQTNGFGSDYAHPRFIAMLLRLGDLLDIDNGRFNAGAELSFGGLPVTSMPHKAKHNATTQILITPAQICFRSDCPDSESYLETRQFVTWLENEVDFLTKYWSKIVPENLEGYAPVFECKELFINGVPDINGVAGLKFEISQEKAFQIIEGSNIYEDRFVFIREVIQNALDASKLQLWKDLTSGTYRAWCSAEKYENLQPFDVPAPIYKNYPIQVQISSLPGGVVQVKISDCGTGISIDDFKRMCSVGTSTSGSEQLRKTIQEMPGWLRPTAGFGIGLQSIFLLTDHFEIDTGTGSDSFHAVVYSRRAGGYLQLQRSERPHSRGTTMQIQFKVPENIRYSLGGETDNYIEFHLDPMGEIDHTGEVRLLEAIHALCTDSMFPIHVVCDEASADPLDIQSKFPLSDSDWKEKDSRYSYFADDRFDQVQLWDRQTATYGNFQFVGSRHFRYQFLFKGIEVHKQAPFLDLSGLSGFINIYGLDTKESISLDRSSWTRSGRKQAHKIFQGLLTAFVEIMLQRLEEQEKSGDIAGKNIGCFSAYDFWRICNNEQRFRIPASVLERIPDTAVVLKREDGTFKKDEVPVKALIPSLETLCYVNLRMFDRHRVPNSIEYPEICSILNQAKESVPDQVIADPILCAVLNDQLVQSIQIPVPGSPLILYTSIDKENSLIKASGNAAKAILLKGLGNSIEGMQYNNFMSSDCKAKRYAIPALSDYSELAVENLRYGLTRPIDIRTYWIIAPFTREENEKREKLSRSGFTDMVTSSETFAHVVDYVMEHSIKKNGLTEEQIIGAYRRLIEEYYDVMVGVSVS